MSLKKTCQFVKGILTEFEGVLSILQECNIIRNLKFEWEEAEASLPKCDVTSKTYTRNDEAEKVEMILKAFKRLVNYVLIMEPKFLSTNLNNCTLLNNNKALQRPTTGLDIEQRDSGGVEVSLTDNEDGVAEIAVDSSLLGCRKSTNPCKICRKRFATVELLNYHLVHLHGVARPG